MINANSNVVGTALLVEFLKEVASAAALIRQHDARFDFALDVPVW